jgi:phosphate transport system permease protein
MSMNSTQRKKRDRYFYVLCVGATVCAVAVLGILLYHILKEGVSWLSVHFLENFPSRFPVKAGIKSALFGSLWIISMTAIISVPLGVATAIYLEEYAPKKRYIRWLQINISNLAGMPSIVYGLLGLTIFVRFFGLDRSLWSGALTLSLLVLPVIIISSQEAIRAVPDSIRYAAYSMGARRWQVVWSQILPAALPGIMTGIILAISRAIGESAPLIMIGALSYVAFIPEGPSDAFTVLPVQIFNWAGRPQADFHGLAGAGIIVLLVILFVMNFIAVLIRQRFQRYKI